MKRVLARVSDEHYEIWEKLVKRKFGEIGVKYGAKKAALEELLTTHSNLERLEEKIDTLIARQKGVQNFEEPEIDDEFIDFGFEL